MFRIFLLIITAILLSSCQKSGSSDTEYNGVNRATPNPFKFIAIYNAEINKFYTSNEISISGLTHGEIAKISVSDGSLVVNGSDISGNSTFVDNNDSVAIKLKSSTNYGLTKTATISLGVYSTDFILSTAQDMIADTFTFNDISDASLSSDYVSNTIVVSGLGNGISVDASISGGTLIYNGLSILDNNISVKNGDLIAIKLTTNADYSSTKESILSIGSIQDTFSVTTFPNVSSVSVNPSTSTIEMDASTVISFTVSPANAPAGVVYSSSDTSVATVNSSGIVTGKGIGVSTITATSTYNNTKYATAVVNVVSSLPAVVPTSITVSPSLVVLKNGEMKVMDALPYPSGSSTGLIWGSSDPTVATVSSDGNVTAIAPGKATITAYSNENMNIFGSATIHVEIYETLTPIGDEDTIGSVVDTVLDSNGTTLYIADSAPGIKAYNLSFEGNVTEMNGTLYMVGSLNVPATTEAIKLTSDDSKLFLANGYNGIREINTTDRTNLVETNSYTTGYLAGGKFAADIVLSADTSRAFVATQNLNGVEWLNLGSTITTVDTELVSGTAYKVDLTSDDKKVLLASGTAGLRVYDVVGSSFSLLGTYTSSACDEVKDIEISKDDRNVYVGCGNGLIQIINIEDLSNIALRGSYQTSQQVESLKLSDDETRLYVANGTMGVIVLDITFYNTITDLIEPRAVSAYNTVGFVKDIELTKYSGEKVMLIGDGGNGLLIIK